MAQAKQEYMHTRIQAQHAQLLHQISLTTGFLQVTSQTGSTSLHNVFDMYTHSSRIPCEGFQQTCCFCHEPFPEGLPQQPWGAGMHAACAGGSHRLRGLGGGDPTPGHGEGHRRAACDADSQGCPGPCASPSPPEEDEWVCCDARVYLCVL